MKSMTTLLLCACVFAPFASVAEPTSIKTEVAAYHYDYNFRTPHGVYHYRLFFDPQRRQYYYYHWRT